METLKTRLIYCLALILMISGFAQDAKAIRFGVNSGLYRESIKTSCARTGEIGLRLGLYFDRSVNDLMYASATRGVNLCDIGCGCNGGQPIQAPAHTPCGGVAPVARSCEALSGYAPIGAPGMGGQILSPASFAPAIQAAPATKTEIYLLVLPNNAGMQNGGGMQQPMQFQQPSQQPVAYYQPQQAAPQYYGPSNQPQQPQYYREPVEVGGQGGPVRGMW